MRTKDLTKISLCVALLCVSSYIIIPLPFSLASITAQTIVINLIGLIMLPKEAFITVFVYILLGACGLPVFSGGTAGFGKLFGPTGGYIVGYLIAAVVISILKGKEVNIKRYILVTIAVGIPLIYLCGLTTMKVYMKGNLIQLLTASVFPFIPGDLLKCIAGSYIAVVLNKRLSLVSTC